MGTKFKDYVKEVEADLNAEGRAILKGFRAHYDLAAQLLELRRDIEYLVKTHSPLVATRGFGTILSLG